MTGLYVHIPFCKRRCTYCAFCSTTHSQWMNDYVMALDREMQQRCNELQAGDTLNTIYLGGGTPSALPIPLLHKVFDSIETHFTPNRALTETEEFTIECNPDDLTPSLAAMLRQRGVNRVSLGVQTFNPKRLLWLQRRHTAQQVTEAVKYLQQAGIDNISIDLIYGFPQQTDNDWLQDIRQALALNVPHISAYCLSYEEGTPLWLSRQRGEVEEADEEQCRRHYYMLIDTLKKEGYEHYEISNFALPERQARHNTAYWQDKPYIGIGAAAHSYNIATRRWNTDDIQSYIQQTLTTHTPYGQEHIDTDTHFNDLITTTLRTAKGLSLDMLRMTFPPSYTDTLLNDAQPWIRQAMLTIDDNHIHLTRKALFVSDSILAALMRT